MPSCTCIRPPAGAAARRGAAQCNMLFLLLCCRGGQDRAAAVHCLCRCTSKLGALTGVYLHLDRLHLLRHCSSILLFVFLGLSRLCLGACRRNLLLLLVQPLLEEELGV